MDYERAFPRRKNCQLTCIVASDDSSYAKNILYATVSGDTESIDSKASWRILFVLDHDVLYQEEVLDPWLPRLVCYAAPTKIVVDNCSKIHPLFFCNMAPRDVFEKRSLNVSDINSKKLLDKHLTAELYKHLLHYGEKTGEKDEKGIYEKFSNHLIDIHSARNIILPYSSKVKTSDGIVAIMKYCLFAQGAEYVLSASALNIFYEDFNKNSGEKCVNNFSDILSFEKNIEILALSRYNTNDKHFREFVEYVSKRLLISDNILEYIRTSNACLISKMFWLQYEIYDFIEVLHESIFHSDIITEDLHRLSLLEDSSLCEGIRATKEKYTSIAEAASKKYNFMQYFVNNYNLKSSRDALEICCAKLRSYDPLIVHGTVNAGNDDTGITHKKITKDRTLNEMFSYWKDKYRGKIPINVPHCNDFRQQLMLAAKGQGRFLPCFGVTLPNIVHPVLGMPLNEYMNNWEYFITDRNDWFPTKHRDLQDMCRKAMTRYFSAAEHHINEAVELGKHYNPHIKKEDIVSFVFSQFLGVLYADITKLTPPKSYHELYVSDLSIFTILFDLDLHDVNSRNLPNFQEICIIAREIKKSLGFIVYISLCMLQNKNDITMEELSEFLSQSQFMKDLQIYTYCCNFPLSKTRSTDFGFQEDINESLESDNESFYESESYELYRNKKVLTPVEKIIKGVTTGIETKSLRVACVLPPNVCFENIDSLKSYIPLMHNYLKISPVNQIAAKYSRGLDESFIDSSIYRSNGSCRLPHSCKSDGGEVFYPLFIAESQALDIPTTLSKCEKLLFDRSIGLLHRDSYPHIAPTESNPGLMLKGAMNFYDTRVLSKEYFHDLRMSKTLAMHGKTESHSIAIENKICEMAQCGDTQVAVHRVLYPLIMSKIRQCNPSTNLEPLHNAMLKVNKKEKQHLHLDFYANNSRVGNGNSFKSCIFGHHQKFKPNRNIFYFIKIRTIEKDQGLLCYMYYKCFTTSCNSNEPNVVIRFPIT